MIHTDVNGSAVTLASSIAYLPYGPPSGLTYGNAKTLSAAYDQDYRPTNRAVSGLFSHAYATDPEGNIIQKGVWTYQYDALNRLDEEDDGSATSYTYDAVSNRLTKVNGGTTTTTVPGGSNRISAAGSDAYAYDAAGNVTDDGIREYVWSAAGLLKEVKISSTVVGTYVYSANNQRAKKTAGGNTVHYVYGLGGLLYGEYDNTGALIREYVHLNGEPLAQIDAGSPEVLTYLHTDHLMTPRYGTNSGGSTVWSWNSDAFGNGAPAGAATVNLRFPGQYYDPESALHYNWNRYYNPTTGRYISSDPIGLAGGLNTFNYANVSPVMLIDPEGLDTEHTKNARPSTKQKHEEGQARKEMDRGGEKGDKSRDPPRKKPKGWKGPWPPKGQTGLGPIIIIIDPCILSPGLCDDSGEWPSAFVFPDEAYPSSLPPESFQMDRGQCVKLNNL